MTPGQKAYEEDCVRRPRYPDGTPRKTWARLGELAQSTWERNPTPGFSQQEIDDEVFGYMGDEPYVDWVEEYWLSGEWCGRWSNGQLTGSCSLAGSEDCDFECRYRGSL